MFVEIYRSTNLISHRIILNFYNLSPSNTLCASNLIQTRRKKIVNNWITWRARQRFAMCHPFVIRFLYLFNSMGTHLLYICTGCNGCLLMELIFSFNHSTVQKAILLACGLQIYPRSMYCVWLPMRSNEEKKK